MRTKDVIDQEVETLRAMKLSVPENNGFGQSNHDAIDAQIRVAEENMTQDEIFYEFGEEFERDGALQMRLWLDEDSDNPSEEWKDLIE